jgi:multidrug efflux pump subunit AcrA (membrane-fusion protein)
MIWLRTVFSSVLLSTLMAVSACDKDDEAAKGLIAETPSEPGIVTLTAETTRRLGLETKALAAAEFQTQVVGIGTVIDPGTILQRGTELDAARAALSASDSELQRTRLLYADDHNASKQQLEAAQNQRAQDAARLQLAETQLRAEGGASINAEFSQALARGNASLVRIDLETELEASSLPKSAEFTALNSQRTVTLFGLRMATTATSGRPGTSLIAMSRDASLRPGLIGEVRLPMGNEKKTGVLVPMAALIYIDGVPSVYVQGKENRFERRAVDISQANATGYFVQKNFSVGELVVTAGNGLLLSQERTDNTPASAAEED